MPAMPSVDNDESADDLSDQCRIDDHPPRWFTQNLDHFWQTEWSPRTFWQQRYWQNLTFASRRRWRSCQTLWCLPCLSMWAGRGRSTHRPLNSGW
ncbi:unnamed protein product [Vitrella brassicaformis CCMP3155]|uniref:Uncharacterized protein n=1 Tax=Vitrella brassicaformis (strain CCMP3155) TaxID=1169540 RepID=A0A0G4EMD0_VITBC|nr:unnamed protein product [Vitrella brassicaformis CCMP3155]|eukprot:CEL98150.1 unnamed protein product [Vitrella brassicaformis CCMP3155]